MAITSASVLPAMAPGSVITHPSHSAPQAGQAGASAPLDISRSITASSASIAPSQSAFVSASPSKVSSAIACPHGQAQRAK
jgi:hypothetical protein